jgi:hypothetical protein
MDTCSKHPGLRSRVAIRRMDAGHHGAAALLSILLAPWSGPVAAGVFDSMHNDPIAPVILGVTGILFFAILGRFAARKIGLPSVLGEVTMGIILGNAAYYLGLDLITVLREGPAIFDLERLAIAGEALDTAASPRWGLTRRPRCSGSCRVPTAARYYRWRRLSMFSRVMALSSCCFWSVWIPALTKCAGSARIPHGWR